MIVRPERPGDEAEIHALTATAFAPMPFSSGTEAGIIDGLRADGDLSLSLVAELGTEIVGHIAFSEVTIGGVHGGWFGLGPVSVRPDRQRQGIGRMLIEEGLSQLRESGASGCVLVGSPAYYERFGFRSDGTLEYDGVPSQYVQGLAFGANQPRGVLTYAPAFERAT